MDYKKFMLLYFCTFFMIHNPLLLQADVFDASHYSRQNDLLYALTNQLTAPVGSDVDTLLFRNSTNDRFLLQRESTPGSDAPGSLNSFGENRAYQHLVFENSGTSNTWVFAAASQDVTKALTANISTKSLTLNNTTLAFDPFVRSGVTPNPIYNYIENLILSGDGQAALLDMNNAHLDMSSSPGTKILFGSAALISVSGTDNRINAPGAAMNRSLHDLELRVNASSSLSVENGTSIKGDVGGFLTLDRGSALSILNSEVFLTHYTNEPRLQSTIEGASIKISGLFGNDPSGLLLTDPRITNSTITLGNNNRFVSTRRTGGSGYNSGAFLFEGDNTIYMASGAQLLGRSNTNDEDVAFFEFSNGKTAIIGSGAFLPKVRALEMKLNNATLEYVNVDADDDLLFLELKNSSIFNAVSGGRDFKQLRFLTVEDSTLTGESFYSQSAILKADFSNATIGVSNSSRTSGMSFFLSGIDGFDPTTKATVTFSGNNTILSRIDPSGKDIGIDQGIVTGIKIYSDQVYFTRYLPYTDEISSVMGLPNVTVELDSFAPGLTAHDYAVGGENGDGVYDVLIFNKDNTATTDATADSDAVSVRFSGAMPALLSASQVSSPAADKKVSYKVEVLPPSALVAHPGVTSSNQQAASGLLINAVNSGNTALSQHMYQLTNDQVSNHLDSIHPEPYSSYMTVSLEYTDTILNAVGSRNHLNDFNDVKTRRGFWTVGDYIDGDVEGSNDLGNFSYDIYHVIVGQDFLTSDSAGFGGYLGWGTQKIDEHDRSIQTTDGQSYDLGLYLDKVIGTWILKTIIGYSYGDHESERYVALGNHNDKLTGDYHSHSVYTGVSGLFNIYGNSLLTLSSELGLKYLYYRQNSFEESGNSDLRLKLNSADAQAIVSTVGLNMRFRSVLNSNHLYPLAFFRYEHDFYANANNEHDIEASFAVHPEYKETFVGQSRGENALTAGIGLGSDLTSTFQIYGSLLYTDDSHGDEWVASAGLNYYW